MTLEQVGSKLGLTPDQVNNAKKIFRKVMDEIKKEELGMFEKCFLKFCY